MLDLHWQEWAPCRQYYRDDVLLKKFSQLPELVPYWEHKIRQEQTMQRHQGIVNNETSVIYSPMGRVYQSARLETPHLSKEVVSAEGVWWGEKQKRKTSPSDSITVAKYCKSTAKSADEIEMNSATGIEDDIQARGRYARRQSDLDDFWRSQESNARLRREEELEQHEQKWENAGPIAKSKKEDNNETIAGTYFSYYWTPPFMEWERDEVRMIDFPSSSVSLSFSFNNPLHLHILTSVEITDKPRRTHRPRAFARTAALIHAKAALRKDGS